MAKKDKITNAPSVQKDDALFETLGKNKKKKKRKIIITVVSIVLVLAMIAAVGVSFLQRRVREQFASSSGEVLSYEVSTGSISTTVSGSGSLTDVDLNSITVPKGVEITEVKVKTNQAIAKGDILATVDMASVISAMADLQVQIEELDAEISDAEDDAASTAIYAGVTGQVKAIFGEAEASVADVMYEHGALALISLDGYMAVDIETDALAVGDSVTVKLSDEEEITGTVESVVGGKVTVLVTDNGPEYDEAVTVLNSEGTQVGTGNLYIHSALKVTGYAGTISKVNTSLNTTVSDTTKLFTLEDTNYSANYNSLLRERGALEETLLELLAIQRDGAILATENGSVYSVDYSDDATTAVVTLSTDEKMSVTISVDEADILSLELGQTVTVSVSSVSEDAFEGTLTEINRTSSSSGTYSAVIEIEKAEGMLSGMNATATIVLSTASDVLTIPADALVENGNQTIVYTGYDEENDILLDPVTVKVGNSDGETVEILEGLVSGQTYYYAYYDTLEISFTPDFGGGGFMFG